MSIQRRRHAAQCQCGWWLFLASMLLLWMQWRYLDVSLLMARRFDRQAQLHLSQDQRQVDAALATLQQRLLQADKIAEHLNAQVSPPPEFPLHARH